jgi:CheY-like chemotaxis protein
MDLCNECSCRIKFAISDTGIGINAEQKTHLFQPFSQADSSTTRKYGGTGLGLSISKQLLKLMGAEIQVESDAGKGSEFSFVLQLPLEEKKAHITTDSNANPLSMATNIGAKNQKPEIWEGARVLLVEDNHVNQLLAQTMLQKGNILVELASNGREAINAIKQESFDLVLMDVQMPVMDGYEATRLIREELKLLDLPVIAMTANALESDRQRCLKIGMNDFLSKPISRENLYQTIGKWRQGGLAHS